MNAANNELRTIAYMYTISKAQAECHGASSSVFLRLLCWWTHVHCQSANSRYAKVGENMGVQGFTHTDCLFACKWVCKSELWPMVHRMKDPVVHDIWLVPHVNKVNLGLKLHCPFRFNCNEDTKVNYTWFYTTRCVCEGFEQTHALLYQRIHKNSRDNKQSNTR